jgi:diguanylate cyclase
MGFFARKTKEGSGGQPKKQKPAMQDHSNDESIFDTLGGILKAWADYPLETEELDRESAGELISEWHRHAVLGTPNPDASRTKETPTSLPIEKRNWRDVRRFAVHHRREEQRHVTGALSELKSLMWDFADKVRDSFVDDRQLDEKVVARLSELEKFSENASLDSLRQQVSSAVGTIAQVIEQRQQRYITQLEDLGVQLSQAKADLLEAKRQMEVDPLTGVYNRGTFDSTLERYVSMGFFSGKSVCLVMVDIDYFKKVNDVHGHRAGDAVLKQLASQIVRSFPRRSDFVARYGGEEFAVLLSDTEHLEAMNLAERFLNTIRDFECTHDDISLSVTCSMGLGMLKPRESSADFVERVDRALYAAKEGGRDQIGLADEGHLQTIVMS